VLRVGNFPRVIYPLSRLTLTRLRLPVLRGARTGTLRKAAAAFQLDTKWTETRACQKMTRQTARANMTDMDRFRVMVLRKQRGYVARRFHKKAAAKPAPKANAPKGKGKGKK
jgi:large subunit ribosomal protein L14e